MNQFHGYGSESGVFSREDHFQIFGKIINNIPILDTLFSIKLIWKCP